MAYERGPLVYRYILPAVAVALVFTIMAGCTQTSVTDLGSKPDEQAVAEEQARLVDEAAERAADKAFEKSRLQEAAATPDRGPHPLVRDLAVARQLVADAQQTEDKSKRTEYLTRLRSVLTAMLAETPASVIVTHIERAELAIAAEQPADEQFRDASAELMAAQEESFGIEPADLVPAVLDSVEAARKKLGERDAPMARKLLADARAAAANHPINKNLRDAAAAVDGAEAALTRDAGAVVKAEFEELARLLELVARVAVIQTEPTPTAEEAAAGAGQQPATGAAVPQAGAAVGTAESTAPSGTAGTTGAAGTAGTPGGAAAPAGATQGTGTTGATGAQQPAAGAGSTTVAPPPPAPSR